MEAENRAQEKKEEGNTEKNKESSQKKCLPVLWKNSSTLRKWLPVFGVAAAFGILLGIVYGINAGSGAAEEVPVPGDMKETVSESQPEPVEENHIVLSEEMKQPEKLAETSDDEQGTSTGEDMNRVDEEGEGISVSKSEPASTLSANRPVQDANLSEQPAVSVSPVKENEQESPQSSGHTHHWVEQTETVYHEAVTQQVYVVDQAAWEEPKFEQVSVYETYGVEVCGVCGAEMYSSAEVSAHAETHIDWETLTNPFYYYTDWRQKQVGTETVQTGTIHHEEEGHYEEQVVQGAHTEVRIVGYYCSECGKFQILEQEEEFRK